MTTKRSLPAFTLIELLLAVVVFVMVATFSTITLATTVRLQVAHKQTLLIDAQVDRAMQAISDDITASTWYSYTTTAGTTIRNWPAPQGVTSSGLIAFTPTRPQNAQSTLCTDSAGAQTNCYPTDSFLVMVVPVRDANGIAIPGKYEKHVYCAQPTNTLTSGVNNGAALGKRLVRFVSDVTTVDANGNQVAGDTGTAFYQFNTSTPPNCNAASVAGKFGDGHGNIMKIVRTDYLTDETTQILNLRFWSVWTSQSNPSAVAAYDAPAIRIELSARYNAGNSSSSLGRLSDTTTPPASLVIRTVVDRHQAYTVNQ